MTLTDIQIAQLEHSLENDVKFSAYDFLNGFLIGLEASVENDDQYLNPNRELLQYYLIRGNDVERVQAGRAPIDHVSIPIYDTKIRDFVVGLFRKSRSTDVLLMSEEQLMELEGY